MNSGLAAWMIFMGAWAFAQETTAPSAADIEAAKRQMAILKQEEKALQDRRHDLRFEAELAAHQARLADYTPEHSSSPKALQANLDTLCRNKGEAAKIMKAYLKTPVPACDTADSSVIRAEFGREPDATTAEFQRIYTVKTILDLKKLKASAVIYGTSELDQSYALEAVYNEAEREQLPPELKTLIDQYRSVLNYSNPNPQDCVGISHEAKDNLQELLNKLNLMYSPSST
jgi:hypothetical protein